MSEENNNQARRYSVDEVLDLAKQDGVTEALVIGTRDDGTLSMYATIPVPSFYHHLMSRATFQVNVFENNTISATEEVVNGE